MPEPPKDLGVKIGTKAHVLWKEVAEEAKALIEQGENNLIIQKAMLAMANVKIAEEKRKV